MEKNKNENSDKLIYIKPYMLKDLTAIYGISRNTMRAWLKNIESDTGKRIGNYYNITQVKIIFKKFDLPSYVTLKDDTGEITGRFK